MSDCYTNHGTNSNIGQICQYNDVAYLATSQYVLPVARANRLSKIDIINGKWALAIYPTGWIVYNKGKGYYELDNYSPWGFWSGASGDMAAVWVGLEEFINVFVDASGNPINNLEPDDVLFQTDPHTPPSDASLWPGKLWCDECTSRVSDGNDWVVSKSPDPFCGADCAELAYNDPSQNPFDPILFGFDTIASNELPSYIDGWAYGTSQIYFTNRLIGVGLDPWFYVSECYLTTYYPNYYYVKYSLKSEYTPSDLNILQIENIKIYYAGTTNEATVVTKDELVDIWVRYFNEGPTLYNKTIVVTVNEMTLGYIELSSVPTTPESAPTTAKLLNVSINYEYGDYDVCCYAA